MQGFDDVCHKLSFIVIPYIKKEMLFFQILMLLMIISQYIVYFNKA